MLGITDDRSYDTKLSNPKRASSFRNIDASLRTLKIPYGLPFVLQQKAVYLSAIQAYWIVY